MPQQPDLFADEIAAAVRQQAENNSVSALKAIPQGTQLSPSQQRFNRMLDRIEKLKKQLHEMQTISDAHRPVYHQTIAPLRASGQALTRELVLWLDKRLARKGLSKINSVLPPRFYVILANHLPSRVMSKCRRFTTSIALKASHRRNKPSFQTCAR